MISCRNCKHLYWVYCSGEIITCKRKPPKTKETIEGLRRGEVWLESFVNDEAGFSKEHMQECVKLLRTIPALEDEIERLKKAINEALGWVVCGTVRSLLQILIFTGKWFQYGLQVCVCLRKRLGKEELNNECK